MTASVPILGSINAGSTDMASLLSNKQNLLSRLFLFVFTPLFFPGQLYAEDAYMIQPGDILGISVWKEDDLERAVIVRPDGNITFPLTGEVEAAGKSVESLRILISDLLKKYIPDPVVTVAIQQLEGNRIYVIGKVIRPGEFTLTRYVDIVQALSMAGGTSTYAALNKIKVLRRENGKLKAIKFNYSDIEKGNNLEQSIILQAGDVVLVP